MDPELEGTDSGVAFEEPQGQVFEGKDNPAWEPFLKDIPDSLHHVVKSHLSEWDKGINSRFQEIHETYKPWKSLADEGVDADTAQYALNILRQLNDDPRSIYDALGQHYAEDWQLNQQQKSDDQYGAVEEEIDPRLAGLESQQEIMAQILLERYEQEQSQIADQEVEQELASLKEKYGDYDERIVVPLMVTGMSGEDAVKLYQENLSQARQSANRIPTPAILDSGGGLPANQVDVTKMNPKDTKGLVAQILEQAARQQ